MKSNMVEYKNLINKNADVADTIDDSATSNINKYRVIECSICYKHKYYNVGDTIELTTIEYNKLKNIQKLLTRI
jgi:hypothetical protein